MSPCSSLRDALRVGHIKTVAILVWCFIIMPTLAVTGRACVPESNFLFQSEARNRLDSIAAKPANENALERLVLMHNLAFHKDKRIRKRAEMLLEKRFPRKERTSTIRAYAGSLKMIRASHRSTGGKVIRTLSPFTKSPYAEAREGYREISEAVASDTANIVLRILRASAATESAEHLHELFDSARSDLGWLETHQDATDSVVQFFLHLNWAKYHFKLAQHDRSDDDIDEGQRHVDLAIAFACTPVYQAWAEEWRTRIKSLRENGNRKW